MRNRLLAGLVTVALGCALGCGEGKKEVVSDPGTPVNTTPPVRGEDPAKPGRVPRPQEPPQRGGPQVKALPAPPPGGEGKAKLPAALKKSRAETGEKVLKELETLPVGIKVVHNPAKLKASRNDGTKTNIDKRWTFEWSYKTTVSTMEKPLDIVEFGSCEWVDGKWAIPADTDEYDVILGGNDEFAEWYKCPKGRLEPGKEFVDPINWSGTKKLRAFKQKWFYIGVDKDGKRYKGEAEVELLGELDTPGKGGDKDKAKDKPDGN